MQETTSFSPKFYLGQSIEQTDQEEKMSKVDEGSTCSGPMR